LPIAFKVAVFTKPLIVHGAKFFRVCSFSAPKVFTYSGNASAILISNLFDSIGIAVTPYASVMFSAITPSPWIVVAILYFANFHN
jgi:hypothetical protein